MAAISIGVVVDDTVHFLSKYLHVRKEQNIAPEDAVKYSFNTVGAAVLITSITLAAGFSVLAFSGFYVNFSIGVLTVIAIIFALLTDFLFLPPLLIAADDKEKRERGMGKSKGAHDFPGSSR